AAPHPTTQPSTVMGDDLAVEVAELVARVHHATGAPLPRAPVAPELPRVLDPAVFASAVGAMAGRISDQSPGVGLGLLDVPERQAVLPLFWRPLTQSHLALIGPTGGGAVSATRLAACGLLPVSGLNACLYCLDGDGSLSVLAESPRVGAYLDPGDTRAAVRLLQRFAGILKDRSMGPNSTPRPLLVLVMTSAGRWLSAFRSSPWPWAEDLLGDVVRDGHRAGVVLVVSGERELLASRLMAGIPNRLFFPKGASAESTIAWPKLPAADAVPGRALVIGPLADDTAGQASASRGHIAQLLWRPDDASAISSVTWPDTVAHFAPHKTTPDQTLPAHPGSGRAEPPFWIKALPDRVAGEAVLSAATARSSARSRPGESSFRPARLLLGLGGDGLDAVTVRIDPGSALLAVGAPGSGKTTLLRALPALNPGALNWLRPGPGESAEDFWIELADSVPAELPRRNADAEAAGQGAAMKVPGQEAAMLGALVDDLQTLSPAAQAALERLRTAGALVVATAPLNPAALMRLPLAIAGRNSGTGLVLAPNRPQDGDFFSCRLDTDGHSPPGRAVLLVNGSVEWLQLAWP
ncbi:MAG: hypothetical protein M3017_02895, partial [Actinomycetota bacterium]|nr:hypothetical protein [Actinomycetota bacterium]